MSIERGLGTLSSGDLGKQITAQPLPQTRGVPKVDRPITGVLASVHHFRVSDQDYTAAIVKVHRTAKQVRDKEPDHREVRGLSATKVEVSERG